MAAEEGVVLSLTSKDKKWLRLVAYGAQDFSTCSKGKYMAAIVAPGGNLLGTGYNGGPKDTKHCVDGGCPRAINNVPSGTPYDFGAGLCIAIHAEQNAIIHTSWESRIGATLYVNGTPCVMCARLISNSGITRVVHLEDERLGTPEAMWFFDQTGIEVVSCTWLDVGI